MKFDYLVLDLETEKLSTEVGGWFYGKMGMSVCCIYDSRIDDIYVFDKNNVGDLNALLLSLTSRSFIVGYNSINFDYRVLREALHVDCLKTVAEHVDIYIALRKAVGAEMSFKGGLKLDNLARGTLGVGKIGTGARAPDLFRQGRWGELVTYCMRDVRRTRDLFLHLMRTGYVVSNKKPQPIRLPWFSENPAVDFEDREWQIALGL